MTGMKGMAVAGIAVAVLMVLTPLAMAHNTAGRPGFGTEATQARHTNAYNNGVSGQYYAPGTAGAVECLGLNTSNVCFSTLFPATGWGATGGAYCDFEYINGDETDETFVDDTPATGGLLGGQVPDGTFDDGGQGGACHTSGYVNAPDGYDTDPKANVDNDCDNDGTAGEPGDDYPCAAGGGQTAPTKCKGTAFASDAVWGGDVPILAGCHFADFSNDGGASFSSCVANAVLASSPDPTDRVDALASCPQLLFIQGAVGGSIYTCVGTNVTSGGSVNLVNLGKGGNGVNVPVPTAAQNPCPTHPDGSGDVMGDVVVFVNALISANPDCRDYTQEAPTGNEDFGWPTCTGASSMDTIVYLPAHGWIDHVY